MTRPILEMHKISKRFPGVIALDSVDFSISAGEAVALAGENGAGKSTLMKILGGVYQPDGGDVVIDGKLTAIGSVRDATAKGIGFVHQELNVLDNLTVAENVFLGREPRQARFLIDRKAEIRNAALYFQARTGGGTRYEAQRVVDRAAADGRDRQGAFNERADRHNGRADVQPDID